ncbi:hypothetical protein HMPREF3034_02195 [Prevotella sp. DNF00663]|nr:hypothetical protein HMPREF3034_02195 [Prevotella sp. DNF00663]
MGKQVDLLGVKNSEFSRLIGAFWDSDSRFFVDNVYLRRL